MLTHAMETTTTCRKCLQVVDVTDIFCRRCGCALHEDDATANAASNLHSMQAPPVQQFSQPSAPNLAIADDKLGLSENPIFILVLLFLVLGPLALPLLWRSRAFSLRMKILLTVGTIGAMSFVAWWTYETIYGPLRETLKLLEME